LQYSRLENVCKLLALNSNIFWYVTYVSSIKIHRRFEGIFRIEELCLLRTFCMLLAQLTLRP
jgi:hypothetical protein